MTAITNDVNRLRKGDEIVSLPVKAGEKIPGGAIVTLNGSGYAQNGGDVAGAKSSRFIAIEPADNTLGQNGDTTVLCFRKNIFKILCSSAITQSSIGSKVYSKDNTTVALAADVTHDIEAGVITEIDSATTQSGIGTECWINIAG